MKIEKTNMPVNPDEFMEEVIFDAEKDNNGKGIAVDDMIKMIQKHG